MQIGPHRSFACEAAHGQSFSVGRSNACTVDYLVVHYLELDY